VSNISEDNFTTYDILRLCHWFNMSCRTLDVARTKYLTRKRLPHNPFSRSPGISDYLKPWACVPTIITISFPTRASRDSAVGIATAYELDDGGVGVRVPGESRIFSSPHRLDRLWGPLSLLFNGCQGPSRRVKWPGCEADHSPPTSAEVKITWIYTSTPSYVSLA
jgi:hypothetical protein